jgi:hypothetical protein
LNNQTETEIIDFLKYGITYLENRIAVVDNKASILIAVQGVFFAVFTYLIKELFLAMHQAIINLVSYVVLGGAFVIFILVVLALLQTIRPSRKIFGLGVPFDDMEIENYIMWFGDGFPTTSDNYSKGVGALALPSIRRNCEKVHFITLQLVRRKYKVCGWAAVGMKVLVSWCTVGIIVLVLFTWL